MPQPCFDVGVYDSGGKFQCWATEKRFDRLNSLGLFEKVVRTHAGQATRAYLKEHGRILLRANPGTRYSFREKLPEAAKVVWTLKRLGVGDELRPIFLRVVTDCLRAPA